jgi:hypothetical protein
VADLELLTLNSEQMKIESTEHKENTNPPLLIASVKARFSDEDFITNLCLSYRHDYGLLGANERNLIRFECKEWLRAIINNWDNTRTHVFPNVP